MVNVRISGNLPIPVRHALQKLGSDIRDARVRRRIATQMMAERASISRSTLYKIEKGNPRVAISHYASVLFILGMINRLADLVDITHDTLGLDLEGENLPKRIKRKKE
jgi:DNA-binding XRE family transcriptional regulator